MKFLETYQNIKIDRLILTHSNIDNIERTMCPMCLCG
jgi:beta-lactamase superfamily II metal-dependent hydrolase